MPYVAYSWPVAIPDVTTQNAGLMTPAMLAQLNGISPPAGSVVINVSSGADQIAAAYAQLPASFRGDCNIFFAPGVYTESQFLDLQLPLKVGTLATDFGLIGALQSAIGTKLETAGDAAGLTFTNGGLAMVVNAFFGETITCVSGANAGISRGISGNTATSVTADNPFPNPISIGDTWAIEIPAVTIIHSGFELTAPAPPSSRGSSSRAPSVTSRSSAGRPTSALSQSRSTARARPTSIARTRASF